MKAKKVVSLALAATLASCALAGCGGSGSGETAAAAPASDEVLVWSSATGPDGEAIQKTIDNYNATNPAMKVKFVSMEADTFNAKLATVGKSGKGVPDLALIASESLPTYQKQGILLSWDDAIAGSEVKADNYVSGAWDAGSVDGSQYGVPATMGAWVMYVNKDLAEKYLPGCLDDGFITYAEIEEAGAAAKADNIYACATTWSMQNYMNIYQQMGGSWLDESGKVNVDNRYSIDAIGEYKKLHDNGWLVPSGEDANKLFMNGQLIFLPEGTWMLSNMQAITSFEWVETFTPQWDLNNIVQCAGADQFTILKSEKERSNEKLASMVDFLTWLQSNQMEWCASGAIPASNAMSENEAFLKTPQSFLATSEIGKTKVRINTTEGTSYVFDEVNAKMWDMINGTVEIPAAFNEIQKIVNEKMGY